MKLKLTPVTPHLERRVTVSAEGDVLKIEVHCEDALLAQVLAEDLTERIRAGRNIMIGLGKNFPA